MKELFPVLAAAAVLLSLVSLFVARRRTQEALALMTDASLRSELTQKQNKQLEQQLKSQHEGFDRQRQLGLAQEKQIEDLKLRLVGRNDEIDKLQNEIQEQARRAILQKEHLFEQVQVLTEQLAANVREKKMATDDLTRLQKETEVRVEKLLESLRAQVAESKQQVQQVRREKQQLESQLSRLKSEGQLVKPEEIKRYQQKLSRTEQLYTSMKGLREMAEERNKNWETALRYLAKHVLFGQQQTTEQKIPLGPLVGGALEKIGASLVLETAEEAARAEHEALQPVVAIRVDQSGTNGHVEPI